jgi:hypothetical protein
MESKATKLKKMASGSSIKPRPTNPPSRSKEQPNYILLGHQELKDLVAIFKKQMAEELLPIKQQLQQLQDTLTHKPPQFATKNTKTIPLQQGFTHYAFAKSRYGLPASSESSELS